VVGDAEAPLREKHDPDFHIAKSTDIASLLSSKPVDAVVSFTQVPSSSHPAWSNPEVEAIIRISSKQVRQGPRFPKGWKVSRQSLTHNSVGGVASNSEVEAIIRLSSKQVRQGSQFPKGWKVSRQSLTHNSVGGVTDGRFWVGIGLRKEPGTICWQQSKDVHMVLK
jgi:hypothetical protein